MKKNFSIVLVSAAIMFASCNSGSSSSGTEGVTSAIEQTFERQKTPEELRMELLQQEQSAPNDYLDATGTYRENFWGDKLKIKCEITNKASVATFKDIVVRVTYYSKTETVLGTNDYTIYEILAPNSTKTVDMKIENYKDVNSIGWHVVNAVPVN